MIFVYDNYGTFKTKKISINKEESVIEEKKDAAFRLMDRAKRELNKNNFDEAIGLYTTRDLDEALRGADCLALVTKHQMYFELDLEHVKGLMRTPVIVDGRGVFDAKACREAGFVYRGVGKGS